MINFTFWKLPLCTGLRPLECLKLYSFGDSSPRTRSTAPDESENYNTKCVNPKKLDGYTLHSAPHEGQFRYIYDFLL